MLGVWKVGKIHWVVPRLDRTNVTQKCVTPALLKIILYIIRENKIYVSQLTHQLPFFVVYYAYARRDVGISSWFVNKWKLVTAMSHEMLEDIRTEQWEFLKFIDLLKSICTRKSQRRLTRTSRISHKLMLIQLQRVSAWKVRDAWTLKRERLYMTQSAVVQRIPCIFVLFHYSCCPSTATVRSFFSSGNQMFIFLSSRISCSENIPIPVWHLKYLESI